MKSKFNRTRSHPMKKELFLEDILDNILNNKGNLPLNKKKNSLILTNPVVSEILKYESLNDDFNKFCKKHKLKIPENSILSNKVYCSNQSLVNQELLYSHIFHKFV